MGELPGRGAALSNRQRMVIFEEAAIAFVVACIYICVRVQTYWGALIPRKLLRNCNLSKFDYTALQRTTGSRGHLVAPRPNDRRQ